MKRSKFKSPKRVSKACKGLADIPIVACVFFTVAGILLGNVMVIGTWHWGKLIKREEATSVSATFESYYMSYGRYGSVSCVYIDFSDYDRLAIDGACCDAETEYLMNGLERGDRLEMLIHPNSGDIWELKSGNVVLLSFENSVSRMQFENVGFTAIGAFMYFVALIGIVSLIIQYRDHRKIKNQSKN
ncbi:MAG: hypothetical protein IJ011_04310 [Clostridia bacterium]|nr:hypothetical protein [Clostridia bacterium]